jgi:hypothetical protein
MRIEWATLCESFEESGTSYHVRQLNLDGCTLYADEQLPAVTRFAWLVTIVVGAEELPGDQQHEVNHRLIGPGGKQYLPEAYLFRTRGSSPFITAERPGVLTIAHEVTFLIEEDPADYWVELALDGGEPIRLSYLVRRDPTLYQ